VDVQDVHELLQAVSWWLGGAVMLLAGHASSNAQQRLGQFSV
jgi:hypothetical protein